MYINKDKEKQKEIERLQKYADAKTFNTARIASQVQNTIKHKKNELLQTDFEELKVMSSARKGFQRAPAGKRQKQGSPRTTGQSNDFLPGAEP